MSLLQQYYVGANRRGSNQQSGGDGDHWISDCRKKDWEMGGGVKAGFRCQDESRAHSVMEDSVTGDT